MSLFFTTPGLWRLVKREVDPDAVHPGPADVIDTVIWSGQGLKLWRDRVEKQSLIQQSLNIVYSHSVSGLPRTVEVAPGQLLLHGDATYRVVLPQPSEVGFMDMGTLLYVKES